MQVGAYLEFRMSVEFVEEIHDGVSVERGGADDDVLLVLRAVTGVRAALLLPLHPRERQLLELPGTRKKQTQRYCCVGTTVSRECVGARARSL